MLSIMTPKRIIFHEINQNAMNIFDTHSVPIYTRPFLPKQFSGNTVSVKTIKGIKCTERPFLQVFLLLHGTPGNQDSDTPINPTGYHHLPNSC